MKARPALRFVAGLFYALGIFQFLVIGLAALGGAFSAVTTAQVIGIPIVILVVLIPSGFFALACIAASELIGVFLSIEEKLVAIEARTPEWEEEEEPAPRRR